MTGSDFARINGTEWLLSSEIQPTWRALLHGSFTFESIVRKLCREAEIVEVHRNRAKSFPGYFRAHVKVRVGSDTCAVFHSGRSGYRAQYYRSIKNGERANAFAVSLLTQAIRSQLSDGRGVSRGWIERSLSGRTSKVWIHQGLWLRYARRTDRVLRVAKWINEIDSTDQKRRKLVLWSSLVPRDEDRIDIKGTFLTIDGEPLAADPKIGRSADLHDLGFT